MFLSIQAIKQRGVLNTAYSFAQSIPKGKPFSLSFGSFLGYGEWTTKLHAELLIIGRAQFLFPSNKALQLILQRGPWSFNQWIVATESCYPTHINFWIQIHELSYQRLMPSWVIKTQNLMMITYKTINIRKSFNHQFMFLLLALEHTRSDVIIKITRAVGSQPSYANKRHRTVMQYFSSRRSKHSIMLSIYLGSWVFRSTSLSPMLA